MNYEENNNCEFLGYIRFTIVRDKETLIKLSNLHDSHNNR